MKRIHFLLLVVPVLVAPIMAAPPASAADFTIPIANHSLEEEFSGMPTSWSKDRWLSNNAEFNYPVAGYEGDRAASVRITSYTSGDAKWYFDDVGIEPATEYHFSDYYKADVETMLVARYKMGNGTYTYQWLADLVPKASWAKARVTFVTPANAESMTVFHLLNNVGTLTIDRPQLTKVSPDMILPLSKPLPGSLHNLSGMIVNKNFEEESFGRPVAWKTNTWLSNDAQFSYPVAGQNSDKAAQVSVTSYISGDSKWYFDDIATRPGNIYRYEDSYKSDVSTELVARFTKTDGTYQFQWIGSAPASTGWARALGTFTVPANVRSLTVFHTIRSVGTLTIDSVNIVHLNN